MKDNTRDMRSRSEGPSANPAVIGLASGTGSLLERQPLMVNTPGDRYEQEADRVADAVIRNGDPDRQRQTATGSRKTAPAHGGIAHETSLLIDGMKQHGQPLKTSTRDFFANRFGHDFSQVRIHADQVAVTSARELGALAYTAGNHIVFGQGQYDPDNLAGLRLMAHELTHVLQQAKSPEKRNLIIQRQESATPPVPLVVPDWRGDLSPMLASTFGSTTLEGFALGSDTIPEQAKQDLRQTARNILYFLTHQYSRSTVEVTGHSDTVDTPERNLKLGLGRANAVQSFLLDEGIPANKIEIATKGDTDLAVPTKDEQPEPRNRRVVVRFKVIESTPPVLLHPKEQPSSHTLPPSLPPPGDLLPRLVPPLLPTPRPEDPKQLWRKMEEDRRKVEEFDRSHPAKSYSLTDIVVDKIMEAVSPVIHAIIPKPLQKMAEDKIRGAIKSGSEKACEAVIDGINGIDGSAKEALKASCKAALKQNLPPGAYP